MNNFYSNNSLKLLTLLLILLNINLLHGQGSYPVLEDIPENQLDEEVKLLGEFDNRLLYFDIVDNETKLWVSDATPAGTFQIGDAEQSRISLIEISDNTAYFTEKIGSDYHISALTIGSNNLVSLYSTNKNIRNALIWNGSIYYIVDSSTSFSGDDLVKFDPANSTTEILFTSDFGGIRGLGATNTEVMFIASMDEGKMLGKTDGTIANTSTFHMLYPAGSEFSSTAFMQSDGDKMFFAYHPNNNPYNLWVSDGSSTGTMILKEYDSPIFGTPDNPFAFLNGKFYFILREAGAPSGNTFDLHVSDGTVEGTFNLNPFSSGYLKPRQLTAFNDKVYFNRLFGNWSLMATDGTISGTETIIPSFTNISQTIGVSYDNGLYNGSLVVRAKSANTGTELFISDGTLAGTTLLSDAIPGTGSSNPSQFTQVGDLLYFTTSINSEQHLWVYDPDFDPISCLNFALDNLIVSNVMGANLGSIQVQVSGGAEPYSYQLNGGTSTLNPLFEDLPVGSYSLLITDANGCSIETQGNVDTETNILNHSLINSFKVFPNPATSENLSIQMSFADKVEKINLEIFDLLGKRIFQQKNINVIQNDFNHSIPVHNLSSGEYLLFVSNKNKRLVSEKITIMNLD